MKIPTWLAVVIIAIVVAGAVYVVVARGGAVGTSPQTIDKMIEATAIGKGGGGGMPGAKAAPKAVPPAGALPTSPKEAPVPGNTK